MFGIGIMELIIVAIIGAVLVGGIVAAVIVIANSSRNRDER